MEEQQRERELVYKETVRKCVIILYVVNFIYKFYLLRRLFTYEKIF